MLSNHSSVNPSNHSFYHLRAMEIPAFPVLSYSTFEAWLKYYIPKLKMSSSSEVYYLEHGSYYSKSDLTASPKTLV